MRILDRWFRVLGVATLVALAVTAAMLATGREAWRVPFVAAHLMALLALVPLGVALVGTTFVGYRRAGRGLGEALGATLAHDRTVTALVVLAFFAGMVSLSQFEGGVRAVRSAANLVTVSAVVLLVLRYLRSR